MYYYYKVFGFVLRSKMEIRQLMVVEETEKFDMEVMFADVPAEIMDDIENPKLSNRYHWTKEYIWMKNIYGIFAIYEDGKIYVQNTSESDVLFLLQFVLGFGICMFAHLKGMVALHCSGVSIDGKGVLITGLSGSGKSTLTSELISDGAKMLSDDVIAAGYKDGEVWIYPAFPQQKLCRDAALRKGYNLDELLYVDPKKDKFAINRKDIFLAEPQKLDTLFLLQWYNPEDEEYKKYNGQVVKYEAEGMNKLNIIMNQLFLMFMIVDVGFPAEHFQLCADLAAATKVCWIIRPENSDTMDEVKKIVYETLGK